LPGGTKGLHGGTKGLPGGTTTNETSFFWCF
jgi:hypothetical protein